MDDPKTWSTKQVALWLRDAFPVSQQTVQLFLDNDVDGVVLMDHHLNHENLKNDFLVEKFGTRCKILSSVKHLEDRQSASAAVSTTGTEEPSPSLAGAHLNKFATDEESTLHNWRSTSRFSPAFVPEDDNIEIRLLHTPLRLEESDKSDASKDDGEVGAEEYHDDDEAADHSVQAASSESSEEEPLALNRRRIHRNALVSDEDTHMTDEATPQDNTDALMTTHRARRSKPSASSTPEATVLHRFNTRGKKTVDRHYFGPRGAPLERFLHDVPTGPPSDSEISEWTVYMGHASDSHRRRQSSLIPPHLMRPGHRDVIQRNIRRILRRPPVHRHPSNPEMLVYAPIRHRGSNVSVKLFKAASTETDRVQSSTWDEVFTKPSTTGSMRSDFTIQGDGSSTIIQLGQKSKEASARPEKRDNAVMSKGINKLRGASNNWLEPGEEDIVLPLYGDSDTDDYSSDEELLREIEQEDREKLDKLRRSERKKAVSSSHRQLGPAEVEAILQAYIELRKERWTRQQQPKLALRAYQIYNKKAEMQANVEKELAYLEKERLPSFQQAIRTGSHMSKAAVERACKALDYTIDLICELQWKCRLFEGSQPEAPARATPRRPRRPRRMSADDQEESRAVEEDSGAGSSTANARVDAQETMDEDLTMLSDGDDEDDDVDAEDDEDDESGMDSFIEHDTDEEEKSRGKAPVAAEKTKKRKRRGRKGKKKAKIPFNDLSEAEKNERHEEWNIRQEKRRQKQLATAGAAPSLDHPEDGTQMVADTTTATAAQNSVGDHTQANGTTSEPKSPKTDLAPSNEDVDMADEPQMDEWFPELEEIDDLAFDDGDPTRSRTIVAAPKDPSVPKDPS
ncbi:hypothetical protein BGZ73_002297, partial [Actinomortierella ambigua]